MKMQSLINVCMLASFIALTRLMSVSSTTSTSATRVQKQACNSALGLENGNIPDSRISASSFLPYLFIGRKNKDMKPKYARLRNRYAWCTNRRERQWLSVDLGKVTYVNAISSQGFQGVGDYYVTTYELAYSIDGTNWKFVSENNATKVFSGNINGVDIKKNSFGQIQARYIKFVPLTYQIRICLRLELFGCFRELSPPTSISSNISKVMSILSNPYSTTGASQSISSTPSLTTGIPQSISSTPSLTTGIPQSISSTQSYPTTGNQQSILSTPYSTTEDKEKTKNLIIGLIIFAALVFLVVLPLLVYLVIRKRKRQANYLHKFQDLPWNSNQ